jgi:hypothetical protein
MQRMIYNPSNWYWVVAGSTTQVWSSAGVAFVPITDETYTAWLAAGNVPTPIASANDLWQVLVAKWLPRAMGNGAAITSTGTPALNGTYATDPKSIANITALSTGIAAGKPLPGGGSTFNYPDVSGTMHAFSAVNFLNFATAIEGLVYAAEQALSTLLNGGTATMPSSTLTIS